MSYRNPGHNLSDPLYLLQREESSSNLSSAQSHYKVIIYICARTGWSIGSIGCHYKEGTISLNTFLSNPT